MMAVIRVNKTRDYTIMSNTHFKEKGMSLKAKGLLSLMLSLPDDWEYSIRGLVSICKENETAIKNTLSELKEFGYLRVTKMMPNETSSGRIEYRYDVFETPQKVESLPKGKQGVENLPVENLPVENQGQLNTKEEKTKESITKNKKSNDRKSASGFQPPTVEEVRAYCIERRNSVDAEMFVDYYTANGWMVGKSKMKDWKAAIRTWERNRFNSKNNNVQNIAPDEPNILDAIM